MSINLMVCGPESADVDAVHGGRIPTQEMQRLMSLLGQAVTLMDEAAQDGSLFPRLIDFHMEMLPLLLDVYRARHEQAELLVITCVLRKIADSWITSHAQSRVTDEV